jgi:hypothetical protein
MRYTRPMNYFEPGLRGSYAEGLAAGLVALRAQGLEPSDYAKSLAEQVAGGKMTLEDMEEALVSSHSREHAVAH